MTEDKTQQPKRRGRKPNPDKQKKANAKTGPDLMTGKNLTHILNMGGSSPVDEIIQRIRMALSDGELKPGMRLPAERKLAEKFNTGRSHVRQALKRLETYGIIKTLPQSGSVIIGLDIAAIDGLLADVIRLDSFDFASLAEMRVVLEESAARLCAIRRTDDDLKRINEALERYVTAYQSPKASSDEISAADFALHRCISEGAHNSVLHSMLLLITPDIMTVYQRQDICDTGSRKPFEEHQLICRHIAEQDAEQAASVMHEHLSGVLIYAQSLRDLSARQHA